MGSVSSSAAPIVGSPISTSAIISGDYTAAEAERIVTGGIARALMIAIEAVARAEGRTLLTLDTWSGGAAERLYVSPATRWSV